MQVEIVLAMARQAINRGINMPLIEVHVIENVFNTDQKRQMIEKLTDAMVSIEGENMRGVTWVKISEVASGEWGIGGKALTTAAVKELASGRKVA
jgi:4-oxalocrotonate tautomerase